MKGQWRDATHDGCERRIAELEAQLSDTRRALEALYDQALEGGFPEDEIVHDSSYAQRVYLRGSTLDLARRALAATGGGTACPSCDGTGDDPQRDGPCSRCQGTGQTKDAKTKLGTQPEWRALGGQEQQP